MSSGCLGRARDTRTPGRSRRRPESPGQDRSDRQDHSEKDPNGTGHRGHRSDHRGHVRPRLHWAGGPSCACDHLAISLQGERGQRPAIIGTSATSPAVTSGFDRRTHPRYSWARHDAPTLGDRRGGLAAVDLSGVRFEEHPMVPFGRGSYRGCSPPALLRSPPGGPSVRSQAGPKEITDQSRLQGDADDEAKHVDRGHPPGLRCGPSSVRFSRRSQSSSTKTSLENTWSQPAGRPAAA
jgi:hypothetical protein